MVKHNISRSLLLLAISVTPVVALAQSNGGSCSGEQNLCTLVTEAIGYFNQAIFLIIALAVVTFIWNVYKYFIISDPENRTEASKYVMFSVIGLFVILSFWGLVNILSNTLNLDTSPGTINIQSLTGSGGSGNSAFNPSGEVQSGMSEQNYNPAAEGQYPGQ